MGYSCLSSRCLPSAKWDGQWTAKGIVLPRATLCLPQSPGTWCLSTWTQSVTLVTPSPILLMLVLLGDLTITWCSSRWAWCHWICPLKTDSQSIAEKKLEILYLAWKQASSHVISFPSQQARGSQTRSWESGPFLIVGENWGFESLPGSGSSKQPLNLEEDLIIENFSWHHLAVLGLWPVETEIVKSSFFFNYMYMCVVSKTAVGKVKQ